MAVVDHPSLVEGPAEPTLFDPHAISGVQLRHDLVPGVAFHPAVARWFEGTFPQGPTPPQVQGWPHIAQGQHTLIAAPTGSGKTLAGFLMCINKLYVDHAAGQATTGCRVMYVSPLKALAVDIAENLERPLDEIAAIAATMGQTAPDINIGIRTGDTPSSERTAMVRKPPAFIVTTPESLYLLATSGKGREALRTVETVIIDEIHAMARDKRGAHMTITLERLDHICAAPPTRVGLSATQRPIETVARLLVGTRTAPSGAPACQIVDGGHQRNLDLEIELPDQELEAVASHSQMDQVLDHISELVAQHTTTLVFVNTRRLAERLAHQLSERLGDDVVSAHHGSLSKDRRHRVERRLRAGELKALVATASLELGIDVGPVELVCQIGSPRSIATFLQRVGRSNHTRHGTPRGRLYPLTRDELVECTALLMATRAGRLDAVEPPEAPLDILAQQMVAECGAQEWTPDDLFALMTRAYHYRNLTRAQFDEVLTFVTEGIMTGRGRRAAWVHHDTINGELRGRKGARLAALTSGGAIPDIYDMRVITEPEETFIGTVNEDWAMESMAGDIFLLGTNSWRIRQVTGGEVRVTDAGDAPPTVPFWTGEAPARTAELSTEVSDLRAAVDRYLEQDDPAGATRWLADEAGVTQDAAALIVAYLTTGRAMLGIMPTQTDLVMERFFDDADGMQLVIHSPWGGRINRAMGYALRKKFCVGFNFELQAAASDDAVVISLGPHHSFPLGDVQRFLTSAIIPETLTQAVLDQPAFQSRWRWNLNRALVVLRMRNGKRNPPPIQRMQSDDMMAALFPDAAACQENISGPITIPDHPIVQQTIHDTLTESLDVHGLCQLWDRLESGEVTMHCVDTTEPSTLAHEILTARPYAFLDDAELPDRRTNAVPIRRGLPVQPGQLGQLDPAAIRQVQEELAPNPRSADELHDILGDMVLCQANPAWASLFEELRQRGRVQVLPPSDGFAQRWHTTENTDAVQVLLTEVPHGELFAEQVAATALRGHLDMLSPATAAILGDAVGLRASQVAVGLATLEQEGSVLQGRFTDPHVTDVEWCSRRLLTRMHAYSRKTRRRGVEASSPHDFLRFLTRWQHVAPGAQVKGSAGLGRIIEQLQGWESAAASWEADLFASRVRDYKPHDLDRLCHDGQVGWLRLTPRAMEDPDRRGNGPSKSTPMTVLYRADLPWLLEGFRGTEPVPTPAAGAVAEILEALEANGARYLPELAADTGRIPTDIEAALWDGVARGLFTADGFEAIRSLLAGNRRSKPGPRRISRLRSGTTQPGRASGRWSLVPTAQRTEERDDLVEAIADQLLQRWGVLFYDLVAHERPDIRWRDLQWALRRLEDRGLIKGGRFVKGFSGEQFALPEAVENLKMLRRQPDSGRTVTVSGSDPLNLTGIIDSGPRTPARRTERVELPV